MWEAFNFLSSSRNVGFSLGAIPLSEIKAYCEMFAIVGEEREDFLVLLRALDDEYMKLSNDKNKRKR